MKYIDHGDKVEITNLSDFDLAKTFECGQCFRWNADENGVYTGVAFDRVLALQQCGNSIILSCTAEDFDNIWRNYFDLDRDYAAIRQQLCVDDFMHRATEFGAGIRLLRQDKWEALCSFIISQNNNIPRIKSIIETLCTCFGEKLVSGSKEYFSFPCAHRLASVSMDDLEPLRCGYRAAYIANAAGAVASGVIDLDFLSGCTPAVARAALMTLCGVGSKVADCVLLFGFNMLDVFPLDVWIKRAVSEHFDKDFDPGIFHPYAGIAQQYIFHFTRNGIEKQFTTK